jgi:hypothetical protein
VTFRRLTFWQRLAEFFSARRRREREENLRVAIRWLMQHPEEPIEYE